MKIGKSDDAKEPSLQCVLKDANGKLVGGFNTYVNNELKVGEPTPFEIRDHSLPKDPAYYDGGGVRKFLDVGRGLAENGP